MSAPSTSMTMTTNTKIATNAHALASRLCAVDERGNGVAQVGRGEDAEEDADRAEEAADQPVTPTQICVDATATTSSASANTWPGVLSIDATIATTHDRNTAFAGWKQGISLQNCAVQPLPSHVPQRRLGAQDLRSARRADRSRLRRPARVRPRPVHDGGAHRAAHGEMDPEGQATVESLARFQQAKSTPRRGSLVRYALSRESVTVLQEATGGLYGWQHPGLPDNLCLYRGDGSPWLVSSAGAHIGYLEVSPFEKLLIGRTAPGLVAVLAHQSARDAILAYMERRFEIERRVADRPAHRIRPDRDRRRTRGPRRRPRGLDALGRGGAGLRGARGCASPPARRAPRDRRRLLRACRQDDAASPRSTDRCLHSARDGASPTGASSSASSASSPEAASAAGSELVRDLDHRGTEQHDEERGEDAADHREEHLQRGLLALFLCALTALAADLL